MGKVKCRINIHGNVREYVPETTYKQLAKEYQKQFPDEYIHLDSNLNSMV